MARKQTSKIWYRDNLHKEIYFQGHYHDAMYKGNELYWKKLEEEGPVINGTPLLFDFENYKTYAYLSVANYKGDGYTYVVFGSYSWGKRKWVLEFDPNRRGPNGRELKFGMLGTKPILQSSDGIEIRQGNVMEPLSFDMLASDDVFWTDSDANRMYLQNSYIMPSNDLCNGYVVKDYYDQTLTRHTILAQNFAPRKVFSFQGFLCLLANTSYTSEGGNEIAVVMERENQETITATTTYQNDYLYYAFGKNSIIDLGYDVFIAGYIVKVIDGLRYYSKSAIFDFSGSSLRIANTIDMQGNVRLGLAVEPQIVRTDTKVLYCCQEAQGKAGLYFGGTPYNLQRVDLTFTGVMNGAVENEDELCIWFASGSSVNYVVINKTNGAVITRQ